MSMYDDFRAPRYVDFLSPDDSYDDSSCFFERDLENNSLVGVDGGSTSTNHCQEIYSMEVDDTIPPQTEKSGRGCESKSTAVWVNGQASRAKQAPQTFERKGAQNWTEHKVMTNVNRPTGHDGTSTLLVKKIIKGGSEHNSKMQVNTIPSSPKTLVINNNNNMVHPSSQLNSERISCHNALNTRRISCSGTPINRRRSLSEPSDLPSNVCADIDPECMLQTALRDLKLGCEKFIPVVNGLQSKQSSQSTATKTSSLRQSVANCVRSDRTVKYSQQGMGRKKRKLSPPNKHVRDYSQPPAKFISMTEHIMKIQKQTPPRFHSKRHPAVQRNVVLAKTCHKESREVPSRSSAVSHSGQGSLNGALKEKHERGVKVARWPAPKVEPLKLAAYKTNEMTHHGVKEFKAKGKSTTLNKKEKVSVGNGPVSQPGLLQRSTQAKPFSFEHHGQNVISKKVTSLKLSRGSQNSVTCSQHINRRRSKSQGAENCKVSKGDFHARLPTVLYKPPFVPKKSQHIPTKPIEWKLSTEQRAKDRAQFEMRLREKEEILKQCQKEKEEKMREEEQRNLSKSRKELVYKARPVPVYQHFRVNPSRKQLTEPHSPLCLQRSYHQK